MSKEDILNRKFDELTKNGNMEYSAIWNAILDSMEEYAATKNSEIEQANSQKDIYVELKEIH